MAEGLRNHWHVPYCYKIVEYDDPEINAHVRKCLRACMICSKELRPEFYYSVIKAPPKEHKGNKSLEKHKKRYGNRK